MQGLILPTWAILTLYWVVTFLTQLILIDPNPKPPSKADTKKPEKPASQQSPEKQPPTSTTQPAKPPPPTPHEPLLVRLATNPHLLSLLRSTTITLPAIHLTLVHYLHTSYPPVPGHIPVRTSSSVLETLCPYYFHEIDSSPITFLDTLPPLSLLGITLVLISAPLRLLCFRQLGRSFTFPLSPPQAGLVKTGLYKYVRHPSYTTGFLAAIGFLLTFMAPGGASMKCFFGEQDEFGWGRVVMVGLCIGVAGLAEMLRQRMEGEERFLEQMFGEEWREYVKKTKKLLPGIY